MSNVVPFPRVDGAAASSSTMLGLSREEHRAVSFANFYSAERRAGVPPEIAHARAEEHARRGFEEILACINQLMSEVG